MCTGQASNEDLKKAFKELNVKVIKAVNADFSGDYLFSVDVLDYNDYLKLCYITQRSEKTRTLLALLHSGQHPQAFIALRQALAHDKAYQHVVNEIDAHCGPGSGELISHTDQLKVYLLKWQFSDV
jgi:hypothetical protein